MTLGSGEVHVWYRLLDEIGEGDEVDAWMLLSSDERARAERFVSVEARQIFVHAHALLRAMLSAYTNIDPLDFAFTAGESGKPALAPGCGDLAFNLSHASGLVACVGARTPVGIDVETLDRRVAALDLATRFFSPPEVSWLTAVEDADRHVRFLELWTLKEAYVKGIGKGLSQPLDTFGFGLDTLPSIRFAGPTPQQLRAWQFALYAPSHRHRLAVAARCVDQPTPRFSVWPRHDGALPGPRPLGEGPRRSPHSHDPSHDST